MSAEFSIFAAANEAPDQVALVIEGEALTFREIADRAQTVITRLEQQGVARAAAASAPSAPLRAADIAPVGVVASNELPTLLMIYALLELAVPVALIHPRLTSGEREELLAEIGARPAFAPDSPHHLGGAPRPAFDAPPTIRPEWPLAIVFTSGTSGRSRAAVLSRDAFSHAVQASAHNLGWQEQERWLLCLPLCHVGGLSIALRCLAARKTVVLAHSQLEQESLDLDRVSASIIRDRVTLLSLVPTVLQRLLDKPGFELPRQVRAILLGGAASSSGLLESAAERAWPVLTTYGLTESCSQVTTQPYGTSNRGELGCGKPVLGVELRIAPDDTIEIKSPSLLSGYQGNDQLQPPLNEEGWFRTSDKGRLDESGNLHVLGRTSELIVTGGENVYPSEVERSLERCPGVSAACVFGLDDPHWGQVVAAIIVGTVALPDLEAYVEEKLAPHKRPRHWARATELPQTALGKLDRLKAARSFAGTPQPLKPGA